MCVCVLLCIEVGVRVERRHGGRSSVSKGRAAKKGGNEFVPQEQRRQIEEVFC